MKFAITDFPTVGGYPSWRQLTLRTIAVSSNGNQQDAFAWASVALSKETRLEDVRVPGAKFESLDGNLAQAILQLANARWGKGNDPFLDELYRQIISHDETCGRNGRVASGREFLWMVASHYSVREERSQIIGVLDMEKIHPKGGDLETLKDFLFRWFQMLSRSTLQVEHGPYANDLKKMFEQRMNDIACMKDICRFYDIEMAQNPNAVDSYVYLRAQAAALIERERHSKNQAELQHSIREAGGKRSNATPAKSGGSAAASGGARRAVLEARVLERPTAQPLAAASPGGAAASSIPPPPQLLRRKRTSRSRRPGARVGSGPPRGAAHRRLLVPVPRPRASRSPAINAKRGTSAPSTTARSPTRRSSAATGGRRRSGTRGMTRTSR